MDRKRLEILAPAGDRERLIMALTYGADAVYLAGERFGMRAAAGNFPPDGMAEAVDLCHRRGVKVYVTCNTVPHNAELSALPPFLEQLDSFGADAVIVTDVGVLRLAQKYAPRAEIHISTQAGVANSAAAGAFYDMGASRVILARELTLAEIAQIRADTPPDLSLEVFGHGAMCVSFSGRCLLSEYMTGRDANRGACAQPCRWKYHLMEEQRPGEYYEISEDGGTFILNSRDLCMIDHLAELTEAGVDSLKIEGRMKSAYYAAAVTNAYRHAADDAARGLPPDPVWRAEVDKVSHREYDTGFFYDGNGPGSYYGDSHYFSDCQVAAQVEFCDEAGSALVTQRNKFCVGDTLELLRPEGVPLRFTVDRMTDGAGQEIESAPHPMMEVRLRLPVTAPRYSFLRKPND